MAQCDALREIHAHRAFRVFAQSSQADYVSVGRLSVGPCGATVS